MREAIGTQTVFKTVLIFTFLFAGFIAVAITYNKAYKLKSETVAILEKYEGVSNKSLSIINNYLDNSGYLSKNTCEDGEYGVSDLNSPTYEAAKDRKLYYYCLSYELKNNQIFYNIKLFSRFNLPFIGDLLYFKITGETKAIKLYSENQKLKG